MKDKELKMKLLEELMEAMDEKAVSKLRPKEDMAVIEEKQVVPADEVGDVLTEKLKQASMGGDSDDSSEEMGAVDEDDDDDYGSRILQKLKAAKAARAMK